MVSAKLARVAGAGDGHQDNGRLSEAADTREEILKPMLDQTAFSILIIIAIILAVVGLVKPSWQTTSVAVLLVAIAVLVGKKG